MQNGKRTKKKSFLDLHEVQVLLGIRSRKTILKYIRTGRLPAYKIGGTRWRFSRDDVDAFLSGERVNIRSQAAVGV